MFNWARKFILVFLSFLCCSQLLRAQHYFFIEADRQQPFYLRMDGQLISSSASGFLLVPKVQGEKMLISIGFPKNQYPEISFELKQFDRDKGFQLKDFGEKGWGLFDRASMEIIMPLVLPGEKILVVDKPKNKGFASMLAEMTGDSTLVERKPMPVVPAAQKPDLVAVVPKPQAVISPKRDSLPREVPPTKTTITASVLKENEASRQMVFVDQNTTGENDTIQIEISKVKADITPKQPSVSKIPVCDRPFAELKDIRTLQRKILALTELGEQIAAVVTAFNEKCFSSRQLMDLGWIFTDEVQRLRLFESIKGKVSDPDQFGKLELVFLKEENVNAFRKLTAKN